MYPFINHNQNDVISKMFWKNLHTLFYTLAQLVLCEVTVLGAKKYEFLFLEGSRVKVSV